MFAQLYIIIIAALFLTIWIRHYYLIHFVLDNYMSANYPKIWSNMKEDTGWYRPSWATIYYTKAIYRFIWKSDDYFGDKNLKLLKPKIKKIVWELPLYFVSVIIITFILIYLRILG